MDTVDRLTRSKIMSSVGQKNTGAEILLRGALHRIGLRYRLHDRSLPGSPDIVFPRYHAVIFVNGCYWHSHGCSRSTIPRSRRKFWTAKFNANKLRDARSRDRLIEQDWRVLTVWECSLRGKAARPLSSVASAVQSWLRSSKRIGEIP